MSLLTAAAAAKELGVSESWVRRHKHELPMIEMGGLIRFDSALLSELLKGKVSTGNLLRSERTPMEPSRYQQGSVFQKGVNKTWYGVFREDVTTPNGIVRKQRKVRLGIFLNKNAALNQLAIEMGITPITDTTFEQVSKRWQKAVSATYKQSTIEFYGRILSANVLPVFKDVRVVKITQEMIQNALAEAAKKYSVATLHAMKVVLGLTLGWAADNDLIRKNPCTKIKLPLKGNTGRCLTRRVITPEQINALVAMLPEPYATLVLLISQTGLRIGEAVAVKASDFNGNVIHITRRIYRGEVGELKTEKSDRKLPVSEELKNRMLRIAGSEWIFSSRTGNAVDGQDGLNYYLRPVCEKLGIPLSGWHDFRHTKTTSMRKAGVHPVVIAGVLGHSKVNIAMNDYDRADAEDIAAALLPNWVTSGNNHQQQNLQKPAKHAAF